MLAKQIENFFFNCKIKYVQGTDEWLANRRYSIGCSEHRAATNTPSSMKQVIKNKVFPSNINYVPAIIWGNLFESSTKRLSEILLDITVMDCPGSVKREDDIVSCSADGIGICKLTPLLALQVMKYMNEPSTYNIEADECTKIELANPEQFMHANKIEQEVIIMFEYKSPASREINNRISKEYQRQVIMGMQCIHIAHAAIFYEASYELLTMDDLKELNNYKFIGCKYIFPRKNDLAFYDDELLEIVGSNYDDYGNIRRAGGRINEEIFLVDAPIFSNFNEVIMHDDKRHDYITEFVEANPTNDPIEFYTKLDKLMLEQGARMVMRWKMKAHNMCLFPRHNIDRTIWDNKCREIIKHVDICKNMNPSEFTTYIKSVTL